MERERQPRVFVIHEERIATFLEQKGVHVKLLTQRPEWPEAEANGLVIIVNPSSDFDVHNPLVINPFLCLHQYHELIRNIFLEKSPPPRSPWQPAALIRCDPESHPRSFVERLHLRPRILANDARWLFGQPQHIHLEGFSADVLLQDLVKAVRHTLARKFRAEREAKRKNQIVVAGSKVCGREPYLKPLLRRK